MPKVELEISNEFFMDLFTAEDTSSLPVPDIKFERAKSDYLGYVIHACQPVMIKMSEIISQYTLPGTYIVAHAQPIVPPLPM